MRYGLTIPPFDELADPDVLVALATSAEECGWDGVFLWDHVQYREPVSAVADPWIVLAAMATATRRVRLGAMVTPLARRRPQVLARQTTTLDRLAGGRLVVGVGLGLDRSGRELSSFGEELDDRTRAAMLDEGLDLLDALWSGEPVDHEGTHYRAEGVRFLPTPVQRPRPPVWVAGRWPHEAPIARAARWDGMFPIELGVPADCAELAARVAELRGGLDGFDIVVQGESADDPTPWEEAGATWWLTSFPYTVGRAQVEQAVAAGPP